MEEKEKRNSSSDDLVVVGSSAGGIEALSILVGTLPKDFPAPIVLAQHLDPTRPSNLDQILQKRATLPVEVVTTSTALQAGHIYVIPANHHVSIRNHRVEVQEDALQHPMPSVDMLLSTAAEAYGEHLTAVILTGLGSDGSLGAVEVKNAEGIVVVQNPQTAHYSSMPLSLPPTIIDYELDLEQIGPLLYELLTKANVSQAEERIEDILREILEHVSCRASIDFRSYKTSTILRRIGRRMVMTHNRSMRDYAQYLKRYPEEVGELVNAFLINVTRFFRDTDAFFYLKNDILPKLIAQARERGHVLRFWTAGCATGEEPYSLAMLLTNLLGAELPQWSIKIFATDLDEAAINFARRGIYSEALLKGVPSEYQDRFFEHIDHGYRISKILRQMVIFGQQDLSRSAPFPRIDLVLCRNVLIYFTPELQDIVLNQFAFSLYPNGYLFLGKAETVRPVQAFYEVVNKQWKVYHCVGNMLPLGRRQHFTDINTPRLEGSHTKHHNKSMSKPDAEQEPSASSLKISQLRRFNEVIMRFLPVGVVVIDRAYRIVTANGMARRLLGLREVRADQDFLHAVHGVPYHQTRTAIDTVFRERDSIHLPEIELESITGCNGRYVSLSMGLVQIDTGLPELAIISVTDVTQQVQARRQLEMLQAEQAQLMEELKNTNKRLTGVNKELIDTNEGLQIANEELVLIHEELQASIEEFETTNEELQATNEELETSNEELQATNEELETTNEELRARTSELQEMATVLENERSRLAEMVELAPFYILVLRGPDLIVEAYNPRYARLIENRPVQGRPLNEVVDLLWGARMEVVHLAREAYRTDTIQCTHRGPTYFPGQVSSGEHIESYSTYTAVPSHSLNGKVEGVIIYAADETDYYLQEAKQEIERLKQIFNNLPTVALALYDAQTGKLIIGSARYFEVVAWAQHLEQSQLIGRDWQELSLISSKEEAINLWQTVLQNQTAVHIAQLPYEHGDKPKIIWDYRLIPLSDTQDSGQVRFVLVSAIDITEQVKIQKELETLNYLQDEFLALTSHELRNPLTAIQSGAQLLQRNINRQKKVLAVNIEQEQRIDWEVSILDTITRQTKRMSKLISEMVDLARVRGQMFELQKKDHVNIVDLVQRVIAQYANSVQKNNIVLTSKEEAILGTWDEDRIEQVLTNLITNALKYSPEDKPIVVEIEQHSQSSKHEVIVSVQDQGLGIAEEDQAHIFDRFYRVNKAEYKALQGLGLGLYISREIVTRHGGRMWVNSSLGQGSTFYFSLPLDKSPSVNGKALPAEYTAEIPEQ
jgi:two-component system CheB/CheR fusion protein